MRFSSKIAPALIVSDMKPQVLYCFDEGSTVRPTGHIFVLYTQELFCHVKLTEYN